MNKSKFLQKVGDDNHALYYHSLFGNLFLLNNEYITILEDVNPVRFMQSHPQIIQDLIDNGYLISKSIDEREILKTKRMVFLERLKK